jgi:hypothetical protein
LISFRSVALSLALLGSAAVWTPVAAQPVPGGRWNQGVLIGAHVGMENQSLFEGVLLGGQMHFMMDPWGIVSFVPSGEFEFRNGVRDWQANADIALMPRPGIYVGSGFAFRNSVYGEELVRETRRGYSLFFGLRAPPTPMKIGVQLELRWTFVSQQKPRMITVGANFPLLLIR